MKHCYTAFFTLVLTLSFQLTSFGQIPNPSFEDWTDGEPDGWDTENTPPDALPVIESSDAHTGSKAVEIGSIQEQIFFIPGVLSTQGFPHDQMESAVNFWMKKNMEGGDQVSVHAHLANSGDEFLASSGTMGTIFDDIQFYPGSNDVWEEFSCELIETGLTGDVASGTIVVSILSSTGLPLITGGSYAIVDDFSFGDSVVSVESLEGNSAFEFEKIFPNPSTAVSTAQYRIHQASHVSIDVIDMQGRLITNVFNAQQAPGHFRVDINSELMAPGIYNVVLKAGDERQVMPLMVK